MAFSVSIEHTTHGVSDECGCPEDHCEIYPFDAILHLEPDGTGHMFLDDGDVEYDEILPARSMEELREQACEFVNNIFNKGIDCDGK